MDVASTEIVIVGCGPGGAEYVTSAAQNAVARADVLVGSRRLLDLFPDHCRERLALGSDLSGLLDIVAERRAAGRTVAVLVSGDPGLHSLASLVIKRFGREQCQLIAGVSAVQVAFARVGLGWADARIVSLHARTPQVAVGDLTQWHKIALLVGRPEALRWAAEAAIRLQASHATVLCQNLTLSGEQIRLVDGESLARIDTSSLSIVLLIRRSLL